MSEDTRLSYSSASLLKNCEQRYWHYKVNKTSYDADIDDSTEAFDIGSAFHYVLENIEHDYDSVEIGTYLDKACFEYEVEDHKAMIHAMILKYLKLHKQSGLNCDHCELAISTDDFVGYIDVIMSNPKTKEWWIVDLKTAGRFSPLTHARLKQDTQLNLYSFFAPKAADMLGLNPSNFAGARYRVTMKPKLKQKKEEPYVDFVKRIYNSANCKSLEVVIPIKHMNPSETFEEHMRLHERSLALRQGEVPHKNFSHCDSYFSPCPYWSNCHGSLHSDCQRELDLIQV